MFYDPKNGAGSTNGGLRDARTKNGGLAHNPFKAIVAPRPIGWISTRGPLGDNLAPYSFFNAVNDAPMQVMFAGSLKDSIFNLRESGVFAVNVVAESMINAMNASSEAVARGVDEFALAGVEKAECKVIDCPRVAQAPATLECRVAHLLELGGGSWMAVGEVVGVHIREEYLRDGRFDLALVRPVARLGYRDYAVVGAPFELERPDD
ncbi:flavin reductase family protein [Cypionkella sp.]|uniref:flavin reductase family protein n=1 Tax=Cypionkella sp. TaxID=2811411 RepID=UPI00260E9F5E|nr:flavin reductase family protein [Cypionkella sp.]MDB5664841.1 flavin reductase domain protein FMN-binding [Cypionkella sp.]